jgi:hypothetical protein
MPSKLVRPLDWMFKYPPIVASLVSALTLPKLALL